MRDLKIVSMAYDVNFEKMMRAHRDRDIKKHLGYVEEEQRLNRLDILIRKYIAPSKSKVKKCVR